MWSLILFALAVVAVVATVEYLVLPQLLVLPQEGAPAGGPASGAKFRPGAFPVWVIGMTALAYVFFDRYNALSPNGNDASVYAVGLVTLSIYEVVTRSLPGKPNITGLPRFGADLGLVLGTVIWAVLHW
jgi:hypothetical protein